MVPIGIDENSVPKGLLEIYDSWENMVVGEEL
jgi:hypothetical protein